MEALLRIDVQLDGDRPYCDLRDLESVFQVARNTNDLHLDEATILFVISFISSIIESCRQLDSNIIEAPVSKLQEIKKLADAEVKMLEDQEKKQLDKAIQEALENYQKKQGEQQNKKEKKIKKPSNI